MTRLRQFLAYPVISAFLSLCAMQGVRPILSMRSNGVPQAAVRQYRINRHVIAEVNTPRADREAPALVARDALPGLEVQQTLPQATLRNSAESPFRPQQRILALCPIRSALSDPAH